jgi:hypothetical protein
MFHNFFAFLNFFLFLYIFHDILQEKSLQNCLKLSEMPAKRRRTSSEELVSAFVPPVAGQEPSSTASKKKKYGDVKQVPRTSWDERLQELVKVLDWTNTANPWSAKKGDQEQRRKCIGTCEASIRSRPHNVIG